MDITRTKKIFFRKLKIFIFTPNFSFRNVLFSIILGFIIAYIVLLSVYGISGGNHVIQSLFEQSFLTSNSVAFLIDKIVVLGLCGLAVAFGMKAGILNIGVSGQMTAGGFLGYILIKNSSLMNDGNNSITLLIAFIIVVLTSVLTALFSGVLKAYLKVNEVISAIMINWLAVYFVKRFANNTKKDAFIVSQISKQNEINDTRFINGNIWTYAIIGVVILIVAIIIIWFYLTKMKGGFKTIATGLNPVAAKYSGYREKIQILNAFAISGFLAGLAGFVLFFLSYNSIPAFEVPIQDGFIGIAVALVAMNNPLAIIPSAILFGLLNGPVNGIILAGFSPVVVTIFSGIITYFVAISTLFLYFRPIKIIKTVIDSYSLRKVG